MIKLKPTANHEPVLHAANQLRGHAIRKIMVTEKYLINFMPLYLLCITYIGLKNYIKKKPVENFLH